MDEKDDGSNPPPSYEETMKKDAEKNTRPDRSQETIASKSKDNSGLRHIHNPHPKSARGFPGAERLTYSLQK